MKKFVSAVVILFVSTTVLFSADLKTYQATYDKQMECIILEHGVTISKLNESYKNALNTLNDRATKAGDLMKIKATMAEVERFNTDKMVTADDAKDSSSDLKKIQLSYMQNIESLETDKARKVITLTSKFDSALAKLQKSLAQQGKIDDATSVMDERDNISKSEDVVSAKAILTKKPTVSSRSKLGSSDKQDVTKSLKAEWISKKAKYTASSVFETFKPLPSLLTGKDDFHSALGASFHTRYEQSPHIIIDLKKNALIDHIEIENRQANMERVKGLTVWVSLDKEGEFTKVWDTQEVEANFTVQLDEPTKARYVKIGLSRKDYLHLAYVKVYGKISSF